MLGDCAATPREFTPAFRRKSRAHSQQADWGLGSLRDFADGFKSLYTTARRLAFGGFPRLPWLTYPAIRHLESVLPPNAKVFEFGGGMSTPWFAERYPEVHTVEDNADWHRRIASAVPHPSRVSCLQGDAFIHKIGEFPREYFDLVVIDGIPDRYQCFRAAESRVRLGGRLVVDDSDRRLACVSMPGAAPDWIAITRTLDALARQPDVYTRADFTGWIPGCFFVKTTTVFQRIGRRGSEGNTNETGGPG